MADLLASGDNAKLADEVRMNVAFEQMVMSVLTGAVVGGGLSLVIGLAAAIFTSTISFATLLSVLLNMMLTSFLIFLVGFFASVIVGAPLFVALENAKRRSLWPYLGASMATALIVFSFLQGGLPVIADLELGSIISIFLPAAIIAVVFVRRMQSYWRAAKQAEQNAATVYRLH